MIDKHEARSIVRKAVKRVPEGEEIRHLNIVPMMDIMTILLVAFLMTAAEAVPLPLGDVKLPYSQTTEDIAENDVTLTIARDSILLQGRTVMGVKNGGVDASEKKDGALGLQMPRLSRLLGMMRASFNQDLVRKGQKPPDVPELLIIADRTTPYKLLFEVILSSRAEEAGFRRFRLILLEQQGGGSAGG
ncbi:MAG TPA: biopolymer transporter ExbD [Kofleriaceae bacterium]|nr:biopolymer transporter ExbD [Kofleriaceae bacterium]